MRLAARIRPTDRECPPGAPGLQQEEYIMNSMARRMFELVEPIGLIPYSADEPNEAMFALGFTNYWDTYFAGRAAPNDRPPIVFLRGRTTRSRATTSDPTGTQRVQGAAAAEKRRR